MMTGIKEKQEQLEAMVAACGDVDAEVRYNPDHGHITIMVWEEGSDPAEEQRALAIQRKIKQQSAQYPRLVCYCFDAFSTLIYAV